jgi:hypothetical protein
MRAIATVSVLKRGVIRTNLSDSTLLMIINLPFPFFSVSIKLDNETASHQTFTGEETQYGYSPQIAGRA